jgi:two-component system chemotaxis response regulator CheY
MRILIVEDDLTSRMLLKKMLEPFGSCDLAVNGKEATEAFRLAQESSESYTLVCMDIMMPEMDGQTALKAIRKQEEDSACPPSRAAKIIMTTALRDIENVSAAFRELCDGYLVKPIARDKLMALLKDLEVIALQAAPLTL